MTQNTLLIKPQKGLAALDLKGLWEYRELLYFLTWRDVKVRYKQTVVGAAWAVFQPFFTMIVFTVFFGKIAKIPSDGYPYPIFSYSGLLLWTYFANAVSKSGTSVVGSANLITKVYFPRLIIPLSSSLSGILDYFIALSLLVVMMFYFKITPGPTLLLLPPLLILTFISATGIGMWLSAMNVKYRDINYIIPFFIQLMLFATPVIYPTSQVPERYRWALSLNPMSGVIEAHRACILGYETINWESLLISTTVGVVLFISGVMYFKSTERSFADII